MDRSVVVRFYSVNRHNATDPQLKDVLEGIGAIQAKDDRVAETSNGVSVRLETLSADGTTALDGEFTRLQTTNYPSEVHPNGTRPLSVAGPLGHGIAFRFDYQKSALAIQYDRRILSPGRAFEYLAAKWQGAIFRLSPKLRDDAWQRFQRGPTRKISITVARPTDYENLVGAGQAAGEAARTLAAAYEAPLITLEMSMGHRKGALSESVKRMAESILKLSSTDEIDLRRMKASTSQGEGVPNDEIDLIDELLNIRTELTLPDNDPIKNYDIRRLYLKTIMSKHV